MTEATQSETPAQLGALDLGSNSFHLLVAQEVAGRIQVLDKYKEMVRLADGFQLAEVVCGSQKDFEMVLEIVRCG